MSFWHSLEKATRFGTDLPSLRGLRLLCGCKHKRHGLRGYSKRHRKAWTAVAELYPAGVSRLIASGCCIDAVWSCFVKLDVSSCCRSKSHRIGEAQNPGPRRVAPRGEDVLEDVPLISAATAALEAKVFLRFHQLGLQKHRIECAASHVRDLPVFRESDSMRLWPRSFCSLRSLEQL